MAEEENLSKFIQLIPMSMSAFGQERSESKNQNNPKFKAAHENNSVEEDRSSSKKRQFTVVGSKDVDCSTWELRTLAFGFC